VSLEFEQNPDMHLHAPVQLSPFFLARARVVGTLLAFAADALCDCHGCGWDV